MTWEKLPGISGGYVGCACCGAPHQAVSMGRVIAVGFGSARVTKNGLAVYSEDDVVGDKHWTAQDAENLAATDPDNDWRIELFAPLYERVYQRQGLGHWVLIQEGQGFA